MKGNLSAVLIAHNEEENIGGMLEGLLGNYRDELLEIIVVNDSSTDRTSDVVRAWMGRDSKVRLIEKGRPSGAGLALKTGFKNVSPKADYVLTMDSDFIENIKEVRSLIEAAEGEGSDGAIGSRYMKGGKLVNYPLAKKIMNRSFHFIVGALFNIRQKDLTNNFKLYKAEIIRGLPWRSDDFAINAETGIFPIVAGYNIAEVPVSWIQRGAGMGKSKFRLFKVGWSYIKVIGYARGLSIRKKTSRKFC
ncbi:MAG: glycosyltransferase family 2 protein [Candidatus Omnitrophica bacterium]|nr:glycosyltransferase family 2 protein [Candidatus Omnitrophota bacterium]